MKIKRLGIVPGTWFDEKAHFITSNVFSSWQIIYRWIRLNEENPTVPFSLRNSRGKTISAGKYRIFDFTL
jgi:hypothetical protein